MDPKQQSEQPTDPSKHSPLVPIILSVLISALVFGGGAYYLGLTQGKNETVSVTPTVQPTTVATIAPTSTPTVSPTATTSQQYTDAANGLSFKYPSDYNAIEVTDGGIKYITVDPKDSDKEGFWQVAIRPQPLDTALTTLKSEYSKDAELTVTDVQKFNQAAKKIVVRLQLGGKSYYSETLYLVKSLKDANKTIQVEDYEINLVADELKDEKVSAIIQALVNSVEIKK